MNTNPSNNNVSRDTNPDAITGEPGSHPVATGLGAAGAGLAGAAIGTALGGPIGGIVGAAVGAVTGGFGGKATGEAVDPTAENAFWRDNHSDQSFAGQDDYDEYAPAYRTGYQGYSDLGLDGRTFEEVEPEIKKSYETSKATVPWEKAKEASKAAWMRVAGPDDSHPRN